MTTPETGRDHAGDLVSAHLDGELDPATAAWVDEHLDACAACASIAEAAAEARRWVRASPSVDATPVVESVIARRRRLVGNGMVFVGAALVVLGLLATTASVADPVLAPDIEALVAAHRTAAHRDLDDVEPVEEVGGLYVTPVALGTTDGPLEREAVYDRLDFTAVVYSDGAGATVSLYEQPGRLDWGALPVGEVGTVAGRRSWIGPGEPRVVVTEVGRLVVTVVGDDPDSVDAALATLPEPGRPSTIERMHHSCERLAEIFALGG